MATPKYQKHIKLILLMLTVILLLLAEPVLARKARGGKGKSDGGARRSQRVERSSSGGKVRASPNVAKSRTKITSPSPSATRQPSPRISRPSGRGNIKRADRTITSSPRRLSPNRESTQPTKNVPKVTRSSRRHINIKRSVLSPSDVLKSDGPKRVQVTVRSSKSESSRKTAHIAKPVRRKGTQLTTEGKKPAETYRKRINPTKSSRIVESIGRKTPFVSPTVRGADVRKPRRKNAEKVDNSSRTSKAPKATVGTTLRRIETAQENRGAKKSRRILPGGCIKIRPRRRRSNFTRPVFEGHQHVRSIWDKSQHIRREGRKITRPIRYARRRRPRIIYEERRRGIRRVRHHQHVYRDRWRRLCHRIIWPRYRYIVYYGWGPWFRCRYVYPYYHRKYIFISLGGYWPIGYNYMRYYWYGWHPYYWYGYYPVPYEVKGDTYNYYTYNYYNGEEPTSLEAAEGIKPVDHNTFADVREKLAAQAAEEPAPETPADTYFEEAVQAFEDGNYDVAAEKFAEAIELAPEDVVLPFAYAQALFANKQYTQAAEILRSALEKSSPEQKEGVFYPRGLYADEQTLLDQIDKLAEEAQLYSFDADLQLLLGYQLLGIGEVEQAVEPLQQAKLDLKNAETAEILLKLLEKIKTQNAKDANQ